MNNDYVWDIETYINCFTCVVVHAPTGNRWIFEVSDRINQSAQFMEFLYHMRTTQSRWFGFNSEGFDYPVVHAMEELFRTQGYFTAYDAWRKAQDIISPKTLQVLDLLLTSWPLEVYPAVLQAVEIVKSKTPPSGATGDMISAIQRILKQDTWNNRFKNTVWANKRLFVQGDLFKIWHYDNLARSTSLKQLEIAMRMSSVVDLPYSPFEPLTFAQMDEIVFYNCHDVEATRQFYEHSKQQIEFRDQLAVQYPNLGDVLNFNDTKIGKKFFEQELEKHTPGICYTRDPVTRRNVPNQTHRPVIDLAEVMSPKIGFDHPEFNRVFDFLKSQKITETKGFFSRFDTLIYPDGTGRTVPQMSRVERAEATTNGAARLITGSDGKGKVATHVGGIDFIFGTGGIHGSLHKTSVFPDDEYDLVDVDVASYYPNLFITGRYFPEHLSEVFCDIYFQLYNMRLDAGKKSLIGQMIKLALNGVYGDTGNIHGPFLDPKCMMQITINGQLMLCMLAELAMMYAGAQMVQINTDGITCRVPKVHRQAFEQVCRSWENHTGLELEHVEYSAMHIRDVNSYLAVKSGKSYVDADTGALVWSEDSGIKRIGAYQYETPFDNPNTRERQWHKNHSALVVPKAAEALLVHGTPIAEFIMAHRDPFDFMLTAKVDRSSRLEEHHGDDNVVPVQRTSRYYLCTTGCKLMKVMQPLKGKVEERYFEVEKGWTVKVVNDASQFDWSTVNWLYYIEEANKLTSWYGQ